MTVGRAECTGLAGAAEAAVAVSTVAQPTARTTAARRTVLTENSMNVLLGEGGPVGRLTWEDAHWEDRVDRFRGSGRAVRRDGRPRACRAVPRMAGRPGRVRRARPRGPAR